MVPFLFIFFAAQAGVIPAAMWKRTSPQMTYFQKAEAYSTASGSTLVTTAFSSTVVAGNLIVCAILYDNSKTLSSVTDTGSNTYTQAVNFPGASKQCDSATNMAIYYTKVTTGGSTFKTTMTMSGSNTHREISCHEFKNPLVSTQLDNSGTSTSGPDVSSFSPTLVVNNNKAMIFSYIIAFQTATPSGPFISASTQNGNAVEYKIQNNTGATTIANTFSPASCYDMVMASFRSK